jgi:hypothetical protein
MSARFAWAKLFLSLAGAASLCAGACASRQPPAAATPRAAAPAAQQKKLAWLPVDILDAPDVARTINDHLGRVKIPGAGASVKAAVSLEMAQLAIECTQQTPACYRAVGKSLGADQMLWGELRRSPTPKKSIRVTLALFDVRAGTPPKRVEKTFDDTQAARAGVADLVHHAFAPGSQTP